MESALPPTDLLMLGRVRRRNHRRESMAGNLLRALFVILISASMSAGIPARAADAPQKIRFAYASRSNIVAPKHIAQSRGYFKAEGLEVEMIQMNPRLSA